MVLDGRRGEGSRLDSSERRSRCWRAAAGLNADRSRARGPAVDAETVADDLERGGRVAAAGRASGLDPGKSDGFYFRPGDGGCEATSWARPNAEGARRAEESDRHLRGDAEVKSRFIEQHARSWPVRPTCRYGIRALAGWRFRPCTTDSRHDLSTGPNLLKQAFSAAMPVRVRLADITRLPTGEGWLRLGVGAGPSTGGPS